MSSETSRIRVVVRHTAMSKDLWLTFPAVEFLLGHGFRMEAPFFEGVPYLSRGEEAASRAAEAAKRDKNSLADIFIRRGDTESLEFVQRVRQEITAWEDCSTVSSLRHQQFQELMTYIPYSRSLLILTSVQPTMPRQAIPGEGSMDSKSA